MGPNRRGASAGSLGKIFTATLLLAAPLLALGAGGCSSSTATATAPIDAGGGSTVNGSGTLVGTIASKSFAVAAAFSGNVTNSAGELGTVLLTDSADYCTDSATSAAPKSSSAIRLQLYTVDPDAGKTTVAAFDTGTYTVDKSDSGLLYVNAQYEAPGVACGQGNATVASGGSVTVTAVEADGSYKGTYSLTFGSDTVTGMFASVDCTTIGMAEPATTCL